MIDPDLLEHIYDVALGRSSWDQVLARLRVEYCADTGLLIGYGQRLTADLCLCLSGHDEASWNTYVAHYAAIDPYSACMRSGAFPAGRVMFGDDLVPGKTLVASEYYNDWFRPHGIRYTAGGHVLSQDGIYLLLGLPRSKEAGPYSPDEIRRLQTYFNHIRRALEIQDEIGARVVAPDLDRIAVRHGLTPAEVRLLELLIETGSLKKSAQQSARSYYTLRAQLRAVFQKTETHSQAQLMRLMHEAPTWGPRIESRD